jgi:hypothetical protein
VSTQANFTLRGRNPDVLSCIANLSNDEVFTPPELANRMLDTLTEAWAANHGGANLWADPKVRFLDPCTKSGVFLREITRRLTAGLADAIPDLQQRVDHILKHQVFGIGITQLTSLLARRSLYCSKYANGAHSIAKGFSDEGGNIWFQRTEHTWDGDRCRYCGAGRSVFDRAEGLETHAYAFVHTTNIKIRITELFEAKMQFDVIIGNPPYQMDDGGFKKSAAPIYQLFVDQAKKLEPRYLSLVIPSRWFAGGKGLDEFRESMLSDNRLRSIDDYLISAEVFPGVDLRGGVCYFLWQRDNPGPCRVATHFKNWPVSIATRPLLENGADVFIRFNEAISILRKIIAVESMDSGSLSLPDTKRFENLVSARKPFGLETSFKGRAIKRAGDVLVYQNGGTGYTPRASIEADAEIIESWKVFISKAYGAGSDPMPSRVLGRPFVGEPGSVSTETYLCIGPLKSKSEADSVSSYLACRLTRFLVLMHKPSQDATRKVYAFVPSQEWTEFWTDEGLYAKYKLSLEEIAFIEKVIRPMDLGSSSLDDAATDADE